MKVKYLKTLEEKIRKVKHTEHIQEQIKWILDDIKDYLYDDGSMQGNTTQSIVRIEYLF